MKNGFWNLRPLSEYMRAIACFTVISFISCGVPDDRRDGGSVGGGSVGGGSVGGGSVGGGSVGGGSVGGGSVGGGSAGGGSAGGGSAGGGSAGGGSAGGGSAGGGSVGGGSAGGGSVGGGSAGGGSAGGGSAGGNPSARDGGVVLEMYWGNQVKGSELVVFDTGRYLTRERVCCPPMYQSDGGTLSSSQMISVFTDVTGARGGPFSRVDGGNALGSLYGRAYGFDFDGTPVLIREQEVSSPLQTNDSAAAERLRVFMNSFVSVELP
jgi:hypothetical protein